MRRIQRGSTDQSIVIRIIDETTGIPETGVVWNTAGIDLWYRREGATKTSIVEATLATLDAAHSDGGFLHIGDGYYRLDLPDAAVATAAGVNGVMVGGAVTGMIVIGCYIELTAYNPYDTVRAGLTALPNAAADAAGGLPISDAGSLDLDAKLAATNEVTAARMGALTDWIDAGRLDALLDAVKAKTDNLPTDPADESLLEAAITAAHATTNGKIDAVDDFVDTEVAAIKAKTDNLPSDPADESLLIAATDAIMARLGAPAGASVSADVAAVKVDTAAILVDTGTTLDGRIPAALVGGRMKAHIEAKDNIDFGVLEKASLNAATPASVTGAVGSITGNVGGNVTGSVGSLAVQAKADVNAEVVDALNVDTYAEPGQEAPAATNTIVKKIGYLFKAWRNKMTQTATTTKIYNDAEAVVDQKLTVSDDATTFTKGEVGSGP